MRMPFPTFNMSAPITVLFAACCAVLAPAAQAQAPTWADPVDRFVSRYAAEDAETYAQGRLGIVLTSYGRGALYEAWRVLALPRGALTQESHAPQAPATPPLDEPIAAWLKARATVQPTAPVRPIDHYKRFGPELHGQFGNCGASAFELAIRTLDELKRQPAARADDQRAWVAAQDAVFDRCSHGADEAPLLPRPAELPASAPRPLQALRQYQRAAAAFYEGDFSAARRGFETIAADASHPLRGWAAVAALRCTLREATLDMGWWRAFEQAWGRQGLRDAALSAALAPAAQRQRELYAAASRSIEERAAPLLADAALASVHPALRELLQQQAAQLTPLRMLGQLFNQLDRVEDNPYTQQTLARWLALYRSQLPNRPAAPLGEQLRSAHPWYDWIQVMQGCADDQPAAVCAESHTRALTRWRETQRSAWLLAAVASLRGATSTTAAADAAALAAARQASPDDAAWPSLQFHAARALRQQGRADEARALLERLQAERSPALDRSARNLVRQERFALATTPAAALTESLRLTGKGRSQGGVNIAAVVGADAAELLDRRLSTEQLLALAQDPATPVALQLDLAGAAWFRAHLLNRPELAHRAAAWLAGRVPGLRSAADRYAAAASADERGDALVSTLLLYTLSPELYRETLFTTGQLRPPGRTPGGEWCGFGTPRLAQAQAVERAPALSAALQQAAPRAPELDALRAVGSGPQWFSQQALATARRRPDHPDTPRLLKAVMAATQNETCPVADAAALRQEAQRLLGAAR